MLNTFIKTTWLTGATVGIFTATYILYPQVLLIATIGAFSVTATLIYILEKAEHDANEFHFKHQQLHQI